MRTERYPGSLCDVQGIRVGHAQDTDARTGVTCVLCERQAVGGVCVAGGAPGTRETDLLRPGMLVQGPDAVLLCGGSAYGLAAADGAMRYLEAQGRGVPVGNQRVPIVSAAVIMDLLQGRGDIRPDAAMGEAACQDASKDAAQGRVGAGTGASIGKLVPGAIAAPGGLGMASLPLPGGGRIAALIVVNAAGDIYLPDSQDLLACGMDAQRHQVPFAQMLAAQSIPQTPVGNTVIGVLATDTALDKAAVNRLAQVGQDGFARTIRPAHTQVDGDTLFALSTGMATADLPMVLLEALASEVVARAIANAFLESPA